MSGSDDNGAFRARLSSEIRSLPLEATMDPGFVHHRRIESVLGPKGMSVIDELVGRLPELPEWQRKVRIDHIYKDVLLKYCELHRIKSLEEALATGGGHLICSVEQLAPCRELYSVDRATSRWVPRRRSQKRVEFQYTAKLVASDTLRSRLQIGETISIVALYSHRAGRTLVFEPLLMGFPWVRTEDPVWADRIIWLGREFFENFIEDFDEFSRVSEVARPESIEPMRRVSEGAFKKALCEILGDEPKPDWPGETSDHFTDHLHLGGRRVTGAFVLKGPARFRPMSLNLLGANNDQIVRLSSEPADILFLQHCHEILPPVRSTLRAFAVQPSRARRYCLIDGWDSLRLLQAYDLLERAFFWSQQMKRQRGKA